MRCLSVFKRVIYPPITAYSLRHQPCVSRVSRACRDSTCYLQIIAARFSTDASTVSVDRLQRSSLSDFGLNASEDTFVPGITLDPFYKEPNVPKRCIGCGALFQSRDSTKPGYVDSDVLREFGARGSAKIPRLKGVEIDRVPEGVQVDKCEDGRFQRLKRRAICRRCYRLQYYKRVDLTCETSHVESEATKSRDAPTRLVQKPQPKAPGILRMPEEADKTIAAKGSKMASAPEVISNMTRRIKSDGLVLYLVDVVNIEATVLPELYIAIRNKAMEVIWIVNKVDVLPDGTDLPGIKRWLRSMARHIGNAKNSDVFLVSSAKGTGFDALERRLKEFLTVENARPIYVVGAVNVGKSTFVNRFLSYISYSDAGTLQMRRGTGGATRSAIPGTTMEFIEFGLYGGFKLIDTPGIPVSSTLLQLLHRPVDLVSIALNRTINPLVIRLDAGQSLLLGALLRIDMIEGSVANFHCFISSGVTIEVCRTVSAEDIMNYKAGVRIFPPHAKEDYERLRPFSKYRVTINCSSSALVDDLVIPGLGWISPSGTGPKVIEVHAPKGLDVLRRSAMIRQPYRKTVNASVLRGRGRLKKVLKLRQEMMVASSRAAECPSV